MHELHIPQHKATELMKQTVLIAKEAISVSCSNFSDLTSRLFPETAIENLRLLPLLVVSELFIRKDPSIQAFMKPQHLRY